MRDLRTLDRYRIPALERELYGIDGDGTCGVFSIRSPVDHRGMAVVAASGDGWDHVSVSRRNRPPNWTEMEHVKRLFFEDHETAMQLHVPPADHISTCNTCLHLWRPQTTEIPRPPARMVGSKRVVA